MQRVFVLDTNKRQLAPCRPSRARKLLTAGKAAVFRRYPFTIILKYAVPEANPEPLRLKIDPGSRTTGIAVVNDRSGEIVFAAELEHRGLRIKSRLDSRRAIRRSRRNRHTRYRQPRFFNRTRHTGWLAPSLKHRVLTIQTWVNRLRKFCNIQAISQELVRFDMQLLENPEISGVEYQQGTLAGYETREYLLEKWGRACAYCGKTNVPLEIEHIQPRSRGGSDRISNLTLACTSCNQKKNNAPLEVFLQNRPELLKKITAMAEAPLRDAAAVNATRWDLFRTLQAIGLPLETGSGGLTKFNRCSRNLPKTHWLDAACVGKSTPEIFNTINLTPLKITAMGHGSRQMCRPDKYGFPRTSAKSLRVVNGFQTGDMVRAVVPTGKKAGKYVGRAAVRKSGSFNIKTNGTTIQGISWKCCTKIHAVDGYAYN